MSKTIQDCIAESFSLRYSDIQSSVRDTAQRFGQRLSRRLAACGVGSRREERERILLDGAQLGLEHFALRSRACGDEGAGDETADPLMLALVSEELGAADLESAVDLLLPVCAAWLADAAGPSFLDDEERGRLLSGQLSVALAAGDSHGGACLFGRSDAVLAVGPAVTAGGLALACLTGDMLARSRQDLEEAGFERLGFRLLNAQAMAGAANYRADVAALDAARSSVGLALGGALVGAMRAATEFALGYAEERQSFGRPIIQHQLVAARLADILIQFESSKLLLWQAASRPDRVGLPMLAAQLRDASQHVFRDALQIGGAHGYVDGLPTAKWLQNGAAISAWLCEFVGPYGLYPAQLSQLAQQPGQDLVSQE
ncbi:acyl-CoA dehydrogenase family protein [Paucibacter sp. XJ19-41]|uniref:acyl-CoA dehydrogenase family protein n=1 Tax=Paucibacter sp. XJ19-41 TaxID=2927824 RepID=UPI00234AF5C4|nr:acyl-CoA dehydrogenase family protein [Paucibacter sp. XJ19-41]MDC6167147.1 acyl-CoA/acyl-ACP dehydrogenase [Paucibacter sp. XJ19-41]